MTPSSNQELGQAAGHLVGMLVKSRFNRDAMRQVAAGLRELAEKGVEARPPNGKPIACGPGCSHCCSAPAFGLPLEYAEISIALQENWPPKKILDFQARLDLYCDDLLSQRDEGYVRFRRPCPFLENGLCTIYPVRPLSCRAEASPDPGLCELWKGTDRVGYRVEPVNQRPERAAALADGVATTMAQSGFDAQAEPMALALRDLLNGRFTPEQYLSQRNPRSAPIGKIWRVNFAEVEGNPVHIDPAQSADFEPLMKKMVSGRPEGYFPMLRKDSTRDLILRMGPARAFHSAEEVAAAMVRIDQAVDEALDTPRWNSSEAYGYLPLLNTVRAGYMPYSMKEWTSKVGRLLVERVALTLAPELLEPLGVRRPGKVRVGVASVHIRAGSPASWTHGWVKNLDRSEFEVFVLNLDGEEDSESYRFKDVADQYQHLSGDGLSIARHIRSLDLDYLIYPDLGDGGWNYRFAMFRLARRQAAGWGCPFTSGLSTIDDYLGSNLMEPEGAEDHYNEKLVRLPNSGVTYSRMPSGLQHRNRASFGLPEGHLIVMGQYFTKWLPQRDEMLARISERSPNPILLLTNGSQYQMDTLLERFEKRRIRVVAMRKIPLPVYLRIMELSDVSLDAPDFSGGHTTFNTLQMKTPVVTLPGEYMRSRQGLALVKIAGAPELAVKDEDEYVELATNKDRLRAAKSKLNPNALFEDIAPVRALERHILSGI